MEIDQIQSNNFPIITNGFGRLVPKKTGQAHKMDEQNPDEEEGANKRRPPNDNARGGGGIDLCGGGGGRFHGWPSSRIVRVSRASGGKDRHSKVLTSKGLRDRRVRLSVNTAIQFYDLQDRLGVDQPSKAVEWLLKAAAASITELPPMSCPFPDMDGVENSEGSALSLSRSGSWIITGERAKTRDADKKKVKENESSHVASFTELLSCSVHRNPNRSGGGGDTPRHWSSDYFNTGVLEAAAGGNGGGSEYNNLNFTIASANSLSSGVAAFNRGTLQSNLSPPSLLPHDGIQRLKPPADGSSPNFFIGGAAAESHRHFLSGLDAGLQLYYGGDAHSNRGKLEKK